MSKIPAIESPTLQGWGGLRVPGREIRSDDLASITQDAVLSRGLGRSYGDASLPPSGIEEVVGTTASNRMLAFDDQTGVLRAQAGVSLEDLKRAFLMRGWFTPVSPGTQYVTLGGMVASDIHGKNHHVAGTIGRHLHALKMRVPDGRILDVSAEQHPELFYATQGGMGLTGHILEVELQLERIASPWIWRESIRVPNIDALLDGLAESAEKWPQTVSWIDTLATGSSLGRGVLMRGRWAAPHEAPARAPTRGFSPVVPFYAPEWTLNDTSMRMFNFAYYWKQLWKKIEGPVSPDGWFYLLDAIQHWYRVYGYRGFTQHQCVIPHEAGRRKVREYIELIASQGGSGFLCVVKDCGPSDKGLLSFPFPGTSVALDLPVKDGIQDLIDSLNRFVLDVGGRIYLTKDAYTRRDHFEAMEGDRLQRFKDVRHKWDPNLSLRSAMSVRLFGDPEDGT